MKLLHLRSLNYQTLWIPPSAKIRIQMYHLVASICEFFSKKNPILTYTTELDDCIDSQIIGSASEIELDDFIITQIIEDQENSPHVAEDCRSVQAAKPTEVPSLQDNPSRKSKPVTGDEPRSMDQCEPLSNLSPQVCLDEVVSLTSERNVEVPFNVSNQAENVRTEVDAASELGSFTVGHPHDVKSIIEPTEPSNNAIPKLVDSVAVEEDEGVARFMEKRDIFDLSLIHI